jgi:hypothetical protein
MEMNDIVFFASNEPPQSGNRPQIQVISSHQGKSFDAERTTLFEKPPARMGQKIVPMTLSTKISEQSENLRLPPAPVPLGIDMENFEKAAMTPFAQRRLSQPARFPRA